MTSSRIRLWFSSWSSPELTKTSFEHPLLWVKTLCAVRGDRAPPEAGGTFKWSKSVKALATLFASYKRDHLLPVGGNGGLSGGAGSDAAALDYALSKKPRWLFDILGSTAEGPPLALRLIDRVNPERKRPGPVTLLIPPQRLSPQNIHIFVEDTELIGPDKLDHLIATLTQLPKPRLPGIVDSSIAK
ncbi:MAG: hypothetical protein RL417_1316 [Pseudomonadota bacterium]|jgi:hypothetical protein